MSVRPSVSPFMSHNQYMQRHGPDASLPGILSITRVGTTSLTRVGTISLTRVGTISLLFDNVIDKRIKLVVKYLTLNAPKFKSETRDMVMNQDWQNFDSN